MLKLYDRGRVTKVSQSTEKLKITRHQWSNFRILYKKNFWSYIKQFLLESINYALMHGELSVEQKRGIISLLPTKDKDWLYLKNWRPISLLNADYKILAMPLALRIIDFVPELINEDQTGYTKGRFISSNIRIIENIMIYTESNNIKGITFSMSVFVLSEIKILKKKFLGMH